MRSRCFAGVVLSSALLVLVGGCSAGSFSEPLEGSGGVGTAAGGTGTGAANVGGSSVGGAAGSAPSPLPGGVDSAALIPARIRRLTNAEYDASVRALTGNQTSPGQNFAPDARQSGFTLNDAQRVDGVNVRQLSTAADALAAEVKANIQNKAPCANTAQAEACAQTFIDKFGAQAYRRPLSAEEKQALLAVYKTGAEGATYADGIELVVRATLQSAGFLYLTEIGDKPAGTATVELTAHELASSLSYVVAGVPPDQALLDAALAGKLKTPEGRAAEMTRLLGTPLSKEKVSRLVGVLREWLGTDRIGQTAKDASVYKDFEALKPAFERESSEFLSEVLTKSTGSVRELLGADWTLADGALATLYQASGQGRVTLPKRRGVLNQGAFLSVYAHATESGPVLRGVAIARRIACLDVPSPTSLNIVVVPPPPDPSKTTRQRFSAHVSDAACVVCHARIDPFGFAFEQYDGMGGYRTMEGNNPVDTSSSVAMGQDFDGEYADSNALARKLSESPRVRECFARHMFRASAARSDESVEASEEAFVKSWQALPESEQGNVLQTLMTFVKSPLFQYRRAL